MSTKDTGDLSQQEIVKLTEGYEKLFRALSGMFRQVGKGQLGPDDAATRVQAVVEGHAPDATAPPLGSRRSPSHGSRRERRFERAQRLKERGDYPQAIEEIKRVIADDARDVRALLKIGDLQWQQGDVAAAIQTYLKVAAFYAEQGFYLKAIAVYKQILKIDGGLIEVHVKLADLYFQLGLMQDALAHFRQVAVAYDRNGQMNECLAMRRKIVDLDPQDVQNRRQLAEAYAKQGLTVQATQEFEQVRVMIEEQRRVERMVAPLFGALGKDAAAPDDDATMDSAEAREAWHRWEARGPHGPIEDGHDDAVIQELLGYFADLAKPGFDGPVSAVRGFARCAEALGKAGTAIEAYEALLARFKDDPNPPAWIAALRGEKD